MLTRKATISVVMSPQQRLSLLSSRRFHFCLPVNEKSVSYLVSFFISGSDFQDWQKWWQRQPVLLVPSEMLRCPKLLKPISWENFELRLSAESVIVWWFSMERNVRRYSIYTPYLLVEIIKLRMYTCFVTAITCCHLTSDLTNLTYYKYWYKGSLTSLLNRFCLLSFASALSPAIRSV